jgi:hypothetical protein
MRMKRAQNLALVDGSAVIVCNADGTVMEEVEIQKKSERLSWPTTETLRVRSHK